MAGEGIAAFAGCGEYLAFRAAATTVRTRRSRRRGRPGWSTSWGIDVEITEGALSGDATSCVQSLRILRAAGLGVAIDDFGTGFSSLARLSELPIDTLKIDQSFTRRLPSDLKNCTLVGTIIGLAQAFGMRTVAEGVESAEQLEYLARAGCDQSQGYFHSRPLPKPEFEAWVLNQAQTLSGQQAVPLRADPC